jgi:hypothetical protein
MRTQFNVEVRGFNAGEYDISDYLARSPELAAWDGLARVIDAAYEAVYSNPEGTKHFGISFVGYSDRAVSGDETARRAAEEKAANERCAKAGLWFGQELGARAAATGQPVYPHWADTPHLVGFRMGVGATSLAAPPGTSVAALKNRRLEFIVQGIGVAAIDAFHEQTFIFAE